MCMNGGYFISKYLFIYFYCVRALAMNRVIGKRKKKKRTTDE